MEATYKLNFLTDSGNEVGITITKGDTDKEAQVKDVMQAIIDSGTIGHPNGDLVSVLGADITTTTVTPVDLSIM